MKLNKNIAEALDMQLPEEEDDESSSSNMVVVEPHELALTKVDNPDLPDMSDIERRLIEGEKELDEVIQTGMNMVRDLFSEMSAIDPKYRNRHMEVVSMIYGNTINALKQKTDLQVAKKKQRMDEANFRLDKESGPKNVTANFYGSQADLLRAIKGVQEVESDEEKDK